MHVPDWRKCTTQSLHLAPSAGIGRPRHMAVQEAGGWAGKPQPTSSQQPITTYTPNLGGSIADPSYDNPTYSILSTTDFSLSPALALHILRRPGR